MSDWIDTAKQILKKSLKPIPQELNEMDWKSDLSSKSDRIAQHISAFANNPNGGYLAFGINDNGEAFSLKKEKIDDIIKKIGNIAREGLAQPVSIDHALIDIDGKNILIVYIPESSEKPVHLRNKDIYESYKRSAGQTRKISKTEARHLVSISTGIDFESQIAMRDVTDDDVFKLIDFDSYFSLLEKRLPDTKANMLETLASDDLIKFSLNLNYNILNLGALLFCKDEPV